MDEIKTKVCTRCGLEKPVEEFSKRKMVKSGLRSECKSCQKLDDAKRYQKKKAEKLAKEVEGE